MFYYYGRKKKIAGLYPEPNNSRIIIEPFAGSGAYSLYGNRWENDVCLYDINPIVIGIWKYLLSASVQDIEYLPNPEIGYDIRKYSTLSKDERNLIGFAINPGSKQPCNIVGKFSRWNANKKYIIENLYKVKHWKINFQSYESVDNIYATWFIDPPYQKMGIFYDSMKDNPIDYSSLAQWCLERNGLAIVCEGQDGNWLNFSKLCEITAIGTRKPKEFVFIKP